MRHRAIEKVLCERHTNSPIESLKTFICVILEMRAQRGQLFELFRVKVCYGYNFYTKKQDKKKIQKLALNIL